MVEYAEREVLSGISLEGRVKEVVSPSEKLPGMVELDAPQLGELAPPILEVERVVESGHREDGSRTNGTNDELVVLDGGGIHYSRAESKHGVGGSGKGDGMGRRSISWA